MTLSEGTRLGRYEIRSKIGEGGMGEVYLAQDTKLDRKVALKILPADVAAHHDRMRRFVQEAKAASALNHPTIITIYEIEQIDSVNFIATEFIDGETLRQRMRSAAIKLSEVLDVTAQIAGALSAAHAAGIIHRDIKPENIMLRLDGIVKVLDFGLAKLTAPESTTVDTQAPTRFKTDPGTVVGTAIYMSPEQARGIEVDARTDIFSLGVVLYEIVAGRLPFEGSTKSEVLASILSEKEPQPLARYAREVPAELERIVSKALRKNRDERYQTIKDLLIDLRDLKRGIELQAQLDRTLEQQLSSRSKTQRSKEPAIAEEEQVRTAQTKMEVMRATSNVEYLVSQMKGHKRGVLLALSLVIIGAIGVSYPLFLKRGSPPLANEPQIKSIAVLPLDNLSGDSSQDYFVDGMTEALTTELTKIGSLRVIARPSAMQFKGARKPLPEIAHELKVDAVVVGSVIRSENRVRISAQLIRAATDQNLWADSYERDLRDVLTLQSEVARGIASAIKVKLTSEEQARFGNARAVNPEAQEAYLKAVYDFNEGLLHFNERPGSEAKGAELIEKSIGVYQQAVKLEPNYALAYAGLARSYHWLRKFPEAKEAAMKAIQLDDTVAEAHGALGYILLASWDWTGAEREIKRSIELNQSSVYSGHWVYAFYLSSVGSHEEAIREIKLAQELDPLILEIKVAVGNTLFLARQYDRAIEQYQSILDLHPNSVEAHQGLGKAYALKGMYEKAIGEFRRATELSNGAPVSKSLLAWGYAISGNRSEAVRILNELNQMAKQQSVDPWLTARIYAALGEKDRAFAELEKVYNDHSGELVFIKTNPMLDNLRSDLRFADLVRRVGVPQ
jgi:serine/threonine protein kinase/tetratricopeptide (TPR) repeat protein